MATTASRLFFGLIIAFAAWPLWASTEQHAGEAAAAPNREIKRFDPVGGGLVVVPVVEVIPGKIYNHFSEQLDRRVWAFALADGQFSHALGEGTTQPIRRFDLPISTEEQMEMVAVVAPRWAKAMRQIGSDIYVRLQADGTWKLIRHSTISSVFDVESGRRWEWHGTRRVAVGHTGGYRWQVSDGRYVPAGHAHPFGAVAFVSGGASICPTCSISACGCR